MKAGRRTSMAPAAPSGVGQLVQSIKQHKKFKQLASYSVQCLTKALLPPTVGWEANTKEAFHAGALEAITEVRRTARCVSRKLYDVCVWRDGRGVALVSRHRGPPRR
jgi:hypothetical protein